MTSPRTVSQQALREMFAELKLASLIASGKLREKICVSRAAPPGSGEPAGSLSQIVLYSNSDQTLIVEVHRYLRADGTIGASGQLDPKVIRRDGTTYVNP